MKDRVKQLWAIVASAAMVLTVGVVAGTAAAAVTDDRYKVAGLSPDGITMNLFDYWLTGQNDPDRQVSGGYNVTITGNDRGINAGHTLKFNPGTDNTGRGWNTWTGTTSPRTGIVSDTLGSDGYPVLSGGTESLAYLFDESTVTGKASYSNVGGLLQLDANGNYYYDSTKNFASYNSDTNSFDLYNTWGVAAGGRSDAGQFFPFNSAEDVFTEQGNTITQRNGVNSVSLNPSINHLFGLHMSATFVQPEGGYVSTGTPMVFNFSGDDDVWLYIDNKLVGDLGGIHDMSTLSINFATGAVLVNGSQNTTLKQLFGLANDTFADGTYHTMDLFYLERGNTDSNLRLTTNLVSVPESEIQKVDQEGNPVSGAEFALYASDADYTVADNANPIATGTTGTDGMLTLVDRTTGAPINFSELYDNGNGTTYYVLRETRTPSGFRTSGDAHLRYEKRELSVTGTLACDNTWETGVNVGAKAIVTAPERVTDYNDQSTYNVDTDGGSVFAVLMARVTGVGDHAPALGDDWKVVSGNETSGWTLGETVDSIDDIERLLGTDAVRTFTKGTDGKYSYSFEELPGDISLYTTQAGSDPDCRFSVGYYYLENDGRTVHRLVTDDFGRNFSTRLYVTDMQNRLVVQKDDGQGHYLTGATFALYRVRDTYVDEPSGERRPTAGATAVLTNTTKNLTQEADGIDLQGGALFPTGNGSLEEGTYYLFETEAPAGYKKNDTAVMVIVDANGVHADAGDANDGISTTVGVGRVAKSMLIYANPNDELDSTLTDIYATRRTGTLTNGTLTWTDSTDQPIKLTYGESGNGLDYGPTPGQEGTNSAGFTTNEGWLWFTATQNNDTEIAGRPSKTDLGDRNLTALFSGSMFVHVSDERVPSLEVTKTVTAADSSYKPSADTSFAFQFTLPASSDSDGKYDAAVYNAAGVLQGDTFRIGNGDTHSIKDGETIRIYGLADGAEYTVTELTEGDNARTGYTLTSRLVGGNQYQEGTPGASISGAIDLTTDGTISSTNQLEFVNTYEPEATTLTDGEFQAQKLLQEVDSEGSLDSRAWNGESFDFILAAENGTPMPSGAEVGAEWTVLSKPVTDGEPFGFGAITYSQPGKYTYFISEVTPEASAQIEGLRYSDALYQVVVTVVDDGNGALTRSVTMSQVAADNGTQGSGTVSGENPTAAIANTYGDSSASLIINKQYSDQSGANGLTADKFRFSVTALGGVDNDDPQLDGDAVNFENLNYTYDAASTPMPTEGTCEPTADSATCQISNSAAGDTTTEIQFVDNDKGKTYIYKVTEVGGSDTSTTSGMTYDTKVYYAKVTVTDNGGTLDSSVVYYLGTSPSPGISFSNTYEVTSTTATIDGQKTLDGFALTTNDNPFKFALTGADEATRTAMTDGTITRDDNGTAVSAGATLTAQVTEGYKGTAVPFSFDKLTFTKAGVYTFNVSENTDGLTDGNGMTYDRHTSTVTVTVVDTDASGNHVGALRVDSIVYNNSAATVNTEDRNVTDAAAFTNRYRASGTYTGIDVTKTLNGHNMTSGQFSFTITPDRSNPIGDAELPVTSADSSFRNTEAVASSETTTMAGKLQFNLDQDNVGNTYTFRVQETGTAPNDGYQYDAETATVSIAVLAREDDKSQLYTVTTITKGDYIQTIDSRDANADRPTVPFVNTYSASLDYDALGGFQIDKTFTTGDTVGSTASDFTFTVTPQATTSTDQSGITTTVTTAEEAGAKLGFTDDQITNGKSVNTGELELNGSQTEAKATINASSIMGSNITFTEADAGKTYTYTVQENEPTEGKTGYKYDSTVYTVTIGIEDNGNGTLTATTTVTKPGDNGTTTTVASKSVTTGATGDDAGAVSVPFTNTYTPGFVTHTPTVTKVLAGNRTTDLQDDEFTFEMTVAAQDGSTDGVSYSKDAEGNDLTTATNNADGAVSFPSVTFTKVGTYTVTIKEQVPAEADPFMTYDDHTYSYTVTVTDENGTLVANADTQNATGSPTFTNTYLELNYSAAGGLRITKTLTGRDMTAGQFEFTVTPQADDATGTTAADAAGKLDIAETGATYASQAADNGDESLVKKLGESTTFSQADAGKTYVYTVAETKAGGEGYDNDTAVRTVSIAISSDADNATLTATTTVSKPGDENQVFTYTTGDTGQPAATVDFVNSYKATPATLGGEGTVKINATKSLTNRPMEAGEFTFTVVNTKDADTTVVNGTNDADGNVSFDGITYTTEKLEADAKAGLATRTEAPDGSYAYGYQYLVSENTDSLAAGVNGVATSFTVTVTVTDNGEGDLAIEVGYPEGSDGTLAFTNTYGADAKADLAVSGTKVLALDDPSLALTLGDIDGKYTFTLSGSEGAPMPAETTAKNDATGNVSFGTITYTMENVFGDTGSSADEADATSAQRTKTFTYTVSESGEVAGVTNDADTSKTFTVTVTDNGDGTINVASDPAQGAKFTFTNTYGVDDQPSAITDQIAVNKTLTGRDMTEGEFGFELVEGTGDDAKVVAEGTNAADGTVTFDKITYTKAGEHDYVIREAAGNAGGVTYDATTYQVHTTVTDAKDGTLKVAHTLVNAEQATFSNTYTADPTSVTIGAGKTLEGRDLEDGEFTFELKDADGNVVSTATNDADGRIVFDPITYTEVGEHVYTITEVKGDAEGVTYDETAHQVAVTVTDDLQGQLVATVSYEGDAAPVFANAYVPPETPEQPAKPEGPISNTGSSVALIGLTAMLLLAAGGAFFAVRRRRQ